MINTKVLVESRAGGRRNARGAVLESMAKGNNNTWGRRPHARLSDYSLPMIVHPGQLVFLSNRLGSNTGVRTVEIS
jgi:hypothetical protein